MLTDVVQRWQSGRASYRPAGETINPRHYEVAAIAEDRIARAFVCESHYLHSYPAARYRFGLYRGARLVGCAVFSVPTNDAALSMLPGTGLERIELGRFVLEDAVEGNGESWFLARAFEHLRREGLTSVLAFSDPEPRTRADGSPVFPGHLGVIYQASNAAFLGRATGRILRLLPDGTSFSPRAMSKIRARDRGWRYATALLERQGAAPAPSEGDLRPWLDHWMPRLTRPLRHPGNFRYAFALAKRDRRFLPASQPYPKVAVPQLALPLAS